MPKKNTTKETLLNKGNDIAKLTSEITRQDAKLITLKTNEKALNSDIYNLKNSDYIQSNPSYCYRKKTLIFANRGVTALARQLLKDLRLILPHHKPESKWEGKSSYNEINHLAELSECDSVCFIESKKYENIMWLAQTPHGPTLKCRLLNIHTMRDSSFTGNCLLYSRPLLTFDNAFTTEPHLQLIQLLLQYIFATPCNHPKSKPFVDHVISFIYFDNHIFTRHYQISPINEKGFNKPNEQILTEIGPQFVLEPILILNGSFNGAVIWKSSTFTSQSVIRKMKKAIDADLHKQRLTKTPKKEIILPVDHLAHDVVFSKN